MLLIIRLLIILIKEIDVTPLNMSEQPENPDFCFLYLQAAYHIRTLYLVFCNAGS